MTSRAELAVSRRDPPTDELVEDLARYAYDVSHKTLTPPASWDDLQPATRANWRAAISALLVPHAPPRLVRQPGPAPVEPGWYYGRQKAITDEQIEPYHVFPSLARTGPLRVFGWGDEQYSLVGEFDWFGRVPEMSDAL